MTTAASCSVTVLHVGDLRYPRGRHRRDGDGRCGDCGTEPGGYHHLGCDGERCPRCGQRLITCGCPFDELDGPEAPDQDPDGAAGESDDHLLRWSEGCPRCGSSSVVPILYGLRNPSMTLLEERGVMELGDSTAPDRPTSRCRECAYGWTTPRSA